MSYLIGLKIHLLKYIKESCPHNYPRLMNVILKGKISLKFNNIIMKIYKFKSKRENRKLRKNKVKKKESKKI
jgi:hypothetical protein